MAFGKRGNLLTRSIWDCSHAITTTRRLNLTRLYDSVRVYPISLTLWLTSGIVVVQFALDCANLQKFGNFVKRDCNASVDVVQYPIRIDHSCDLLRCGAAATALLLLLLAVLINDIYWNSNLVPVRLIRKNRTRVVWRLQHQLSLWVLLKVTSCMFKALSSLGLCLSPREERSHCVLGPALSCIDRLEIYDIHCVSPIFLYESPTGVQRVMVLQPCQRMRPTFIPYNLRDI